MMRDIFGTLLPDHEVRFLYWADTERLRQYKQRSRDAGISFKMAVTGLRLKAEREACNGQR